MTHSPLALRAQWAWRVTLYLQLALLAAVAIDHFLLRTTSFWLAWLVQTLPLLATLPGIYARRARSGIWLCFLLLFYFLLYVDRTVLDSLHRVTYLGMIGVVTVHFVAALCFARWQRMVDTDISAPTSPTP